MEVDPYRSIFLKICGDSSGLNYNPFAPLLNTMSVFTGKRQRLRYITALKRASSLALKSKNDLNQKSIEK